MKITVRVKPGSSRKGVEEKDSFYKISIHSRPHDGEANEELIEIISDYFKVPKTRIKIVSGLKSRNKIIEII